MMSKKKNDGIPRFYIPEIEDLKRIFITHPLTQHKNKFSPSEASGAVELGWHRGRVAGIHDAYEAIKGKYPKAAKALLAKFNMSPSGTITLFGPRSQR